MVIPTPQYISKIIGKLKDLKNRKSVFWKAETKKVEALAESFGLRDDTLSVEEFIEELGEKGKSLKDLYGVIFGASVKGEKLPPKFNPKSGRQLSLDEILGGISVWFENRIPSFPTSVLQGLLDQVILPLYSSNEIQVNDPDGRRTQEGRRLDSLRDAVRRELKRRTEKAERNNQAREAIPKACKAITAMRLLKDGWPQDIQTLINEINVLLFPYYGYLTSNGSWGVDEQKTIEEALKSIETDDLKKVIHELNKIECKMKVEAKQKPAEPEQETEPQGKGGQSTKASGDKAGHEKDGGQSIYSQNKQENIIDLKPNLFGIGLNLNAFFRKIKLRFKNKKS
jgi:hypothetical protein